MKTTDCIKAIMNELIDGYSILQVLLQKERQCLINLNASQIDDLLKEKDTVVMRLKLLENERRRLLRKYYIENGIRGEIDKSILFKIEEDETFESLRLQLLSLLQSIAELNEFNRILIDRTNLFFKNTMQVYESAGINLPQPHKTNILSMEA